MATAMPFDESTTRALLAITHDLSLAARRAVENIANRADGSEIDRALAVYDALDAAIRTVNAIARS